MLVLEEGRLPHEIELTSSPSHGEESPGSIQAWDGGYPDWQQLVASLRKEAALDLD